MSRPRAAFALSSLLTLTASAVPARADVSVEACSDAYTKGQEERLAGREFSARSQFKICDDNTCPNAIVKDCQRWTAEVEAELPTVVIKATNLSGHAVESLHVWIDGTSIPAKDLEEPVLVDAGPHTFRLEAPGFEPLQVEASTRPEDRKFPVNAVMHPLRKPAIASVAPVSPAAPEPQASPEPGSFPVAATVLAGVGLVALGGSVYFGIAAKHRYDELKGECAPICSSAQGDSVRSKALVSDIALATSVVAFGAAAWVYFSATPDAKTTALAVEPRPDGARLRLRLAF